MEGIMKKNIRLTVLFILILTLLLSACQTKKANPQARESGSNYIEYPDYELIEEDMMMDMAYGAENSVAAYSKAVPVSENNGSASTQTRMIQKSANIQIQVMDPLDAAEKLITQTEQMGGFVVSSTSSQEYYSGDIYLPRANLAIRVPSERLIETLEFIENLTSDASKYVSNKRVYGVDITSDYVDTSSRLTSLEKTRNKLYEILDTAENAEEALDVYNRISGVESDIEVLKGQIKYMEESVAFSSIDVTINSIRPAPISTVSKWSLGDVFKDAFESLLDACKSVIEFLIYFVIVIVPIIILIAIPVVIIILVIRKVIRNKNKSKVNVQKNDDTLVDVKKE